MWLTYSLATALLLACGVLFAKTSIKRTEFEIVSAIKILIILLFSWYLVFTNKVQKQIAAISYESIIDIVVLGILICGGMLTYHAALKNGGITRATSLEKLGSVLILFLGITAFGQNSDLALRIIGAVFIAAGSIIMISGKSKSKSIGWLLPGCFSAVIIGFAYYFTQKEIIGKINTFITLALALTVSLLISLVAVFIRGITSGIGRVMPSEILFSILSGISFCLAIAAAIKTLTLGHTSVCYAIMHLGSVFSILGASLFFKEKLTWKTACGLLTIVCGIVIVVFLVGVYNF